MAKETKKPDRRTQVKDLPKDKKELSPEEQKKVKGGASMVEYALLIIRKPKSPGA